MKQWRCWNEYMTEQCISCVFDCVSMFEQKEATLSICCVTFPCWKAEFFFVSVYNLICCIWKTKQWMLNVDDICNFYLSALVIVFKRKINSDWIRWTRIRIQESPRFSPTVPTRNLTPILYPPGSSKDVHQSSFPQSQISSTSLLVLVSYILFSSSQSPILNKPTLDKDQLSSFIYIYIYYYAEAAITLYTNKLYTHTSRIKPN